MKDEAKQWLREQVATATERLIIELEARPVYFESGEEVTMAFRVGFTSSPNRPWLEPPDVDGEGTHIELQVTFGRTEAL